MPKKIILTFLSICMLTSSVCYAQEPKTVSHSYKEGIYTIGVDIPMGEYVFLTNDPDEIGYYVIYDGQNAGGAAYKEKYYIKDEEQYSYPDLMKEIDIFRNKYSDVTENSYDVMFYDYFEYCTVVDFRYPGKYGMINEKDKIQIFPFNMTDTHKSLNGCYIKLVNCCAVPEAEITKLDVSRNGSFKPGRDFPKGQYTVEYVQPDMSDIRYFTANNIFGESSKKTSSSDLYITPKKSSDSIFINKEDYVEKRDVSLKDSAGNYIAHKPRKVKKSDIDDKYDISQVRESFRKNISDEIEKNLGNRYYYNKKAKFSMEEDKKIADNWLMLANNDAEKQYVYMVREMYYLINEYLSNSAFTVSKEGIDAIEKNSSNIRETEKYSNIANAKSNNIAAPAYKQLFEHIQNAKSFSDIKYMCDKMIADMY